MKKRDKILIPIILAAILWLAGAVYADLTGTEGLAIDLSSAGPGTDFTIAFDPTELLGSRTWGDASTDTIVWTWNRATGTDPTITFNSGSIGLQALTLTTDLATTEGGTGASSLNDLITLTTHTTGNYVATLADSGNSIFTIVNGSTEGGAATLDLAANGVDDTHIDWGTGANQVSAADIPMAIVAGATFTTVQHMQNIFHSAGWVSGGGITDDADGTITVAAGTGMIRATDGDTAEIVFTDWSSEAGANVNLADNDISWVYVEYNAGSPRVIATTTERTDFNTNILLGNIQRSGTTLHINVTTLHLIGNHATNMIRRMKDVSPYGHVSGGILSEKGTRNIDITAGSFWQGLTSFSTSAVDTSAAGTFTYYYNNGTWQSVATQTAIHQTNYNNFGVGLATLSNNKYGVHWVYIEADDDDIAVVYGIGDYTLTEARDAQPPSSVPEHLEMEGILAGKIIIKKSDAAFTQTESAFQVTFSGSLATDHGSLAGLGDDDHTQYVLVDGSRELSANWDVGAFTITGTQFISDIATGTAPFVVASTTEVANLLAATATLATTATALATPRTIGGVSFDGSANIVPTTIAVTDTADTTSFVALWESATGDLLPQSDLGLTYNATTGILAATGYIVSNGGFVGTSASGPAWVFDSSNGDVTTQHPVGIGTTVAIGDLTVVNNAGNAAGITPTTSQLVLDSSIAGGMGQLAFTIEGTIKGGIRVDNTGNFNLYAAGYHQFFNSTDNSAPVMSIVNGKVLIGGSVGQIGTNSFSVIDSVSIGYAIGNAAPSNGLIVGSDTGIGTNAPADRLDVTGGGIQIQEQADGFAIVNTTQLGIVKFYGDDDTASADAIAGQIEVIATGTWTNGAEDAKMVLNAVDNGTLNANQIVLETDGSVTMSGNLTASAITNTAYDSDNNTLTNIVEDDCKDGSDLVRSAFEFVIDGGGSAITTGTKGDLEIPFNCVIQRVTMSGNGISGSIVIDIWVDNYSALLANTLVNADSITASATPTITTAFASQDATLTGWTTALTAGDWIRYNVDSATTIERCTISLLVEK